MTSTSPAGRAHLDKRHLSETADTSLVDRYISDKPTLRIRLRRLEGQIRGIERMVDIDRSCIDILTQISAVTNALEGVALSLLDDHLKKYVRDAALTGGPVSETTLVETWTAIARLVRS